MADRQVRAQYTLEYCREEFQTALKAWGVRSSMSRKGNCWDSAPTESFRGRLKAACIDGKRYATRQKAMDVINNWMAFNNHSRPHSSLGYLSPMLA